MLLAPLTPPPQPQHGGAGRAGPRPLCPLPAVVLSRILRVFPPRLWPARRQRWRGDARRRRVGGPSVGRRRSFRGGAGATDGTKNATWFLVKRKNGRNPFIVGKSSRRIIYKSGCLDKPERWPHGWTHRSDAPTVIERGEKGRVEVGERVGKRGKKARKENG